jgi:protein TonB
VIQERKQNMFEQTFVGGGKTKTTWTMLGAMVGQVFLVIVFILIPMIYFEVLPAATLTSFLVAPPPPPPPPPPPAEAPPVKVVKVIPRQFDAGKLMAPKEVPKQVAIIREEELPPPTSGVAGVVGGVPGGVAGGSPGGVLGGILGSVPSAAPPPPPPPKKVADAAPQRIRVGGNVQQARLMRQPKPVYPPLAKQARIQGVVKLSAVISKDGTIQELTVISGHPLLVPSALEAVKQWVYQPTLLNGEAVEVATQIDVNFTLSQ